MDVGYLLPFSVSPSFGGVGEVGFIYIHPMSGCRGHRGEWCRKR